MDGVHRIISKSIIHREIYFPLVGVNLLVFVSLNSVDIVRQVKRYQRTRRMVIQNNPLILHRLKLNVSNSKKFKHKIWKKIIQLVRSFSSKHRHSIEFDISVTVYWNYLGDNGGMLLNAQRFHSSMPSVFGPSDCYSVLKSIFDCCIKCSFQPTSFLNRIHELFPSSDSKQKNSTTEISRMSTKKSFICIIFICISSVEDGTSIDIPSIENDDEFWQIIHRFPKR